MANHSAILPFDNYVQDGDQSLEQAIQDVAAINGGERPSVSERVRNPSTGKLIQVRLSFPEAVGQAAVDAINANPGIVSTCLNLPIPLSLVAKDLNPSGPDGIVYAGSLTDNDLIQALAVFTGDDVFRGGVLGFLKGSTYTDVLDIVRPFLALTLNNNDLVTSKTYLAADVFTLNFKDGSQKVLTLQNDVIIPPSNFISYWVDDSGNLYIRLDRDNAESHTFDFSTSCLGAV